MTQTLGNDRIHTEVKSSKNLEIYWTFSGFTKSLWVVQFSLAQPLCKSTFLYVFYLHMHEWGVQYISL